jgi:hypothetical protein
MLSVVTLSVVTLNIIMLSVVAPKHSGIFVRSVSVEENLFITLTPEMPQQQTC